jgi:hypothetical protein
MMGEHSTAKRQRSARMNGMEAAMTYSIFPDAAECTIRHHPGGILKQKWLR